MNRQGEFHVFIIRPEGPTARPARRLTIVAATLMSASALSAHGEGGHHLETYVGADVAALQRDLGEPNLKTPTLWRYSSEQQVSGGMPGAPNPVVIGGRRGVTVSGAGGDYEPWTIAPDICEVTVTLDKNDVVTGVDAAGPGCFEYLHALKRAAQAAEQAGPPRNRQGENTPSRADM